MINADPSHTLPRPLTSLVGRLFGSAYRHFSTMGSHFHPLEQPAHDAAVALARNGLGEPVWAVAWEAGRALPG